MVSPVRTLLDQHPTNPVRETNYVSNNNKAWAKDFAPIKKFHVRTFWDEDGATNATFDEAFQDIYEDDDLKSEEPAYPPNNRQWRLAYEADAATCGTSVGKEAPVRKSSFRNGRRRLLSQTGLLMNAYTHWRIQKEPHCPEYWQAGKLQGTQETLSRELRGRFYGKPWGHRQRVDICYGAFYWTNVNGADPFKDEAGQKVWETASFWEPEDTVEDMESTS
ncbi:uncharacterized protein MKZ38_008066 [Zalerion maritima]|uniref:Uncharacterized protein n=1 Tax=Zalerion maritima TaxID=339359 RepID=A0AAD5RHD9_9PEZI|nr:uncharacterized protein MKZ38_008066 [Zalerion maritima]